MIIHTTGSSLHITHNSLKEEEPYSVWLLFLEAVMCNGVRCQYDFSAIYTTSLPLYLSGHMVCMCIVLHTSATDIAYYIVCSTICAWAHMP